MSAQQQERADLWLEIYAQSCIRQKGFILAALSAAILAELLFVFSSHLPSPVHYLPAGRETML